MLKNNKKVIANTNFMKSYLYKLLLYLMICILFITNFSFLQFTYATDSDQLAVTFISEDGYYSYNLILRVSVIEKLNNNSVSSYLQYLNSKLIMCEYALKYMFVNYENVLSEVEEKVFKDFENATIEAENNTGNIYLKNAKNGSKLNKTLLNNIIFNNLVKNNYKISVPIDLIKPEISDEEFANSLNLKSKFSTSYAYSSAERKHNIRLALSKFNGLILAPQQELSFNNVTGPRTVESGYKDAKVILDGQFADGIGGGVCQASTTLYNACLLAGLQIKEANQHSLKVGYVEPSFDAMVNYGTSDLKVINNTNSYITFAVKCDDNKCNVYIYGEPNEYEVRRKSAVINEIEPEPDLIVEECNVCGEQTEKYISLPKKGLVSEGYLEYYKNGTPVAVKLIRKNKYNSSRGIKVVYT